MSRKRELARMNDRWHVVELRDAEKVRVACGETRRSGSVELSPEGETPDDLTGTTVCYDCDRRVEQ